MTTIHLVYPHSSRISCPDAIGRNLAERLRVHYNVRLYDWDETCAIVPGSDDILLGHPHPAPWTCFRRSMSQSGWRKIIAMSPYCHGDLQPSAFLDAIISRVDLFLAITGRYWYTSVGESSFSHWRPKMIHLDLAVDRNDFPVLKTSFNPLGERRFVYIGHSGWYKNVAYLTAIAKALPEMTFAWIGSSSATIPSLISHGFQDFQRDEARAVVASYDFMLTVGRSDPNPTTILEAMAWGLIPVCTPQSGYIGYPGIINVPLDNLQAVTKRLRMLQKMSEATLWRLQQENWNLIEQYFTWDRFAQQVIDAIEAPKHHIKIEEPLLRKAKLYWTSLISPFSIFHPIGLKMGLANPLRKYRNFLSGQHCFPKAVHGIRERDEK